jgi:hypothetical protein
MLPQRALRRQSTTSGMQRFLSELVNPSATHRASPAMRFSGHETFPCRYAWLPRAYRALATSDDALADDESAMIRFGVGKNMVQAIRFWVEVTDLAARAEGRRYALTPLAHSIFGTRGHDRYLEDVRTLWLMHWHIASQTDPLFAWDFLLNRWQQPDFTRSDALKAFVRAAESVEKRKLSNVTLAQHLDIFLHTYLAAGSGDPSEDDLDCPLAQLDLLQVVGERRGDGKGRLEPVFAFRRERKPEVSAAVFAYCLYDYWRRHAVDERTLSFRHVSVAPRSVGQLFKLPEDDLRERLERIEHDSGGVFGYRESATQQAIVRLIEPNAKQAAHLLEAVYA